VAPQLLTRRSWLAGSASVALLFAGAEPPRRFPADVSHRLAVSTYPFRKVISPARGVVSGSATKSPGMSLDEFAASIPGQFGVFGIEPWSEHFESLEQPYLQMLKAAFGKAGVTVVNIACDVKVKPCGSPEESAAALDAWSQWVDAAVLLGSPSIRVHLPPITVQPDDLTCAVQSLGALAQYGESRGIVINLENDDPKAESPQRILKVIDQVKSPFLRALPDFCNSLLIGMTEAENRTNLAALFPRAFNISHVKNVEISGGKEYRVDMDTIFAVAKAAQFTGYFSMEDESGLDPYMATRQLIAAARKNLTA
jgi:sugar phosphate isomerase/epimerase